MRTYCNARKKGTQTPKMDPGENWAGEGYCKKSAGSGTDHHNQGRCKNHGGCSVIKSGMYSKIQREDLRELVEHFENAEDPLDLSSEVALARAFLLKFINRYEAICEALLDWHTEYCLDNEIPTHPAPKLPSQQHLIVILDTISKIVKRIQEMKSDHTVTRKDLHRILLEMGRVVESEVDEDQWKRIRSVWLSIKLA